MGPPDEDAIEYAALICVFCPNQSTSSGSPWGGKSAKTREKQADGGHRWARLACERLGRKWGLCGDSVSNEA